MLAYPESLLGGPDEDYGLNRLKGPVHTISCFMRVTNNNQGPTKGFLLYLTNEAASRCALSGRQRSRRQRGVCGDFVNLEDLPAQSSKMLIEVGLAYVCS